MGRIEMLSCRQTVRLTLQRLDRPLLPLQRVSRWGHLLICGHCRAHARQVRGLLFVLNLENNNAKPYLPGLSSEARSRIAAAMAHVDPE
jgi:predicted anti-sigma-YlaC factor YlaD